jgi:hypothetical protein
MVEKINIMNEEKDKAPYWGKEFVELTDIFYRTGKYIRGMASTAMFVASVRILVEEGNTKETLISLLEDLQKIFEE